MRWKAAFTLVEIMIVVAIIATLAALALPGFIRARRQAQNARFFVALRVARDAFETYAAENNKYPPDELRRIIPIGMKSYFGPTLNWTGSTPVGGDWDWDYKTLGINAGVSVLSPTAPRSQMLEIDAKLDDGDLTTGAFRETVTDRYTWIIE